MQLVEGKVPNLVGGVSQQDKRQRFPNQMDEVLNCENDIIRGIRKRHGTRYQSTLLKSDNAISENVAMSIVDRGESERFIYTIDSSGKLQVTDFYTGYKYPVVDGQSGYLSSSGGDINDDIQFISIGDETLILNKNMKTEMLPSLSHSKDSGVGSDKVKTTTIKFDHNVLIKKAAETIKSEIGTNDTRYDKYLEKRRTWLRKNGSNISSGKFAKGEVSHHHSSRGSAFVSFSEKFKNDHSVFDEVYESLGALPESQIVKESQFWAEMFQIDFWFSYDGKTYTKKFDALNNTVFTSPKKDYRQDLKVSVDNALRRIAVWINETGELSHNGEIKATSVGGSLKVSYPSGKIFSHQDRKESKYGFYFGVGSTDVKTDNHSIYSGSGNYSGIGNPFKYRCGYVDTWMGEENNSVVYQSVTSTDESGKDVAKDIFAKGTAALVWINQLDYNVKYEVDLAGTKYSITTPAADSTEASKGLSSDTYTEKLRGKIDHTDTNQTGYSATVYDGVILISKNTEADFDISVDDGLYGNGLKLIKNVISDESELPYSAPKGYIVKVQPSSQSISYYLAYSKDGRDGVWAETVAPMIKYKINPKTMPHVISSGFNESHKDETNNPQGMFFKLSEVEWDSKEAGDDESSPTPSFIDNKIKTMSFSRNRLWFFGGDWVCSSASGEIKRWFPITVANVLDDSPIGALVDVRERKEDIRQSLPVEDGILLFSDRILLITSFDQPMTNMTINIKDLGNYETSDTARPANGGNTVYFISDNRSSSRVYGANLIQGQQRDFVDITEHCPTYVSGDIKKIVAAGGVNKVFMLSKAGDLYVYNSSMSNGSYIQKCWSRWVMSGKALDVEVIGERVYFVVMYEKKITVEYMELSDKADFMQDGLPIHLDRMYVTDTEPKPEDLSDGEIIVTRGDKVFVGIPYIQEIQMSDFFRASDGTDLFDSGVTKIRNLTLNLSNSSHFDITVSSKNRADRVYEFRGRVMGESGNILGVLPSSSGEFQVPVMLDKDDVSFTIKNDSTLECNIVSMNWRGKHHNVYQKV